MSISYICVSKRNLLQNKIIYMHVHISFNYIDYVYTYYFSIFLSFSETVVETSRDDKTLREPGQWYIAREPQRGNPWKNKLPTGIRCDASRCKVAIRIITREHLKKKKSDYRRDANIIVTFCGERERAPASQSEGASRTCSAANATHPRRERERAPCISSTL